MIVLYKKIHPQAQIPSKQYVDDAGYDLTIVEDITIQPGEFSDVPTGLRIALPQDIWGRITGRSSTLRNHGLMISEGIIDPGYRGDMFVGVKNLRDTPATIQAGHRIAQLILHYRVDLFWEETEKLPPSERGERGFGSTGK